MMWKTRYAVSGARPNSATRFRTAMATLNHPTISRRAAPKEPHRPGASSSSSTSTAIGLMARVSRPAGPLRAETAGQHESGDAQQPGERPEVQIGRQAHRVELPAGLLGDLA